MALNLVWFRYADQLFKNFRRKDSIIFNMSLFVHSGTKTKLKLKRISTGSRETMSQFTNVKQSLAF